MISIRQSCDLIGELSFCVTQLAAPNRFDGALVLFFRALAEMFLQINAIGKRTLSPTTYLT